MAGGAKADGILIFTIGRGESIDREQLQRIASKPEWYFEAADGDDPADAYRTVGITIPCPPQRYWGKR